MGDLSLIIPVVQLELGTTEPSSGVDPVFCREIFPNILRRLSDNLNSCIGQFFVVYILFKQIFSY